MTDHLLIRADARRIPLASKSVHCVMTSPPFFGLRDYGTATWEGGDPACTHDVKIVNGPKQTGQGANGHASAADRLSRTHCGRCGARRVDRQIGLEPTVDEFVAAIVAVFKEIWRVLRDDGCAWLNLGDSYNSTDKWGGGGENTGRQRVASDGSVPSWKSARRKKPARPGLKPKDLCLIPERVALALQAAGWFVRAKPPWVKVNPMTESVTDRPSVAHETLYLLSKRATYYYDADATRAPLKPGTVDRERAGYQHAFGSQFRGSPNDKRHTQGKVVDRISDPAGRNRRTSDWFAEALDELIDHHEAYAAHLRAVRDRGGLLSGEDGEPLAFRLPTQPWKGAHYATFPERLVAPCIQASTSEAGVCARCGAPWERVTEREQPGEQTGRQKHLANAQVTRTGGRISGGTKSATVGRAAHEMPVSRTTGWHTTCSCNAGAPVPAIVLDPFVGSGTTLVVAGTLGRRGIGCDLSADHLVMARQRVERPHAPVARPPGGGKATPLLEGLESV